MMPFSIRFIMKPNASFIKKFLRIDLFSFISREPSNLLMSIGLCTNPNKNFEGRESLFLSSENSYSHDLLSNNISYSESVVKLQDYISSVDERKRTVNVSLLKCTPWLQISLEELVLLFESISLEMGHKNEMNIADECYNEMCSAISSRCDELNDEQLALIFKSLTLWCFCDSRKSNNFHEIWRALDKVCLSRFSKSPPSKVFYFLDLWYSLRLIRQSDFAYVVMSRYIRRPSRLSPQQLVQLLFYINVIRSMRKDNSLYEVEYCLENFIEKLSLEELGIAAMGFFKTEKKIHSEKILNHIIDRINTEMKSVHEISLACLFKALRKSIPISLWPRLPELLGNIDKELDRVSLTCAVHASLLTTGPQIVHESLFKNVCQKLVDNITLARMKDMEKGICPLALLDVNVATSPCLYETLIDELSKPERKEEIMSYPKCFVAIVNYLCVKGIYNYSFIEEVLDMGFIIKTYGDHKYSFGRELLLIDTILELECHSYNGPRLPTDIRNYLSKRYAVYLPDPERKLSKHLQWHLEIIQTAESLFGKEFVTCKYLLPNHPRADIIFGLDDTGNPIALPQSLKDKEDFTGPIQSPGNNFYALVVGSKNMFLFDSVKPNGETALKLKQLKLLGFKPILVPFCDWPTSSTIEKLQFLKKLVGH